MRIKVNVSAFEVEVLDRKGERAYYVKSEGYVSEFDADTCLGIGEDLARRIKSMSTEFSN